LHPAHVDGAAESTAGLDLLLRAALAGSRLDRFVCERRGRERPIQHQQQPDHGPAFRHSAAGMSRLAEGGVSPAIRRCSLSVIESSKTDNAQQRTDNGLCYRAGASATTRVSERSVAAVCLVSLEPERASSAGTGLKRTVPLASRQM